MNNQFNGVWVKEITVKDPDTGNKVQVKIWKDPVTGGIFGIDASWMDCGEKEIIKSPFGDHELYIGIDLQGIE